MSSPDRVHTALVTGANSGIGLATTQALVAEGWRVWLLCRSEERGQAALETLEGPGEGRLVLCDLADPSAIAQAAAEVAHASDHLDVLVNNAAMYSPTRVETAEGLERTFAINHLGHFRLTLRLMPLLQAAEGAQIITVASRNHREGRIVWDDLQRQQRRYTGMGAYNDSKLCNVLFTLHLARLVEGGPMRVNAVSPGTVGTGFAQDEPGFLNRLFTLAKPLMLSPTQGADTVVWLATADEARAHHGAYLYRRRAWPPGRRARDPQTAARLWQVSSELAGPLPPLR